MIKSAEYTCNPEINVKELYSFALREKAAAEDYGALSENFIGANKPILTTPGNFRIKTIGNISYGKETHTYYAGEPGYIH